MPQKQVDFTEGVFLRDNYKTIPYLQEFSSSLQPFDRNCIIHRIGVIYKGDGQLQILSLRKMWCNDLKIILIQALGQSQWKWVVDIGLYGTPLRVKNSTPTSSIKSESQSKRLSLSSGPYLETLFK